MMLPRLVRLSLLLGGMTTAAAGSLEVQIASPDGTPVEDFAVALEPSTALRARKAKATILQQDREFSPYLTVVQTGTAVEFPNRDPFKHHVYSFSQPKMFEIKLYAGKPAKPVVFDKPGVVALGCNVHDWMEAYVLVVDTPYFAKTGADGRARIANVPAGTYQLKLWHPRLTPDLPIRKVSVGKDTLRLSLQADVPPRPPHTKPPMDEVRY
jgi:plastocyanin